LRLQLKSCREQAAVTLPKLPKNLPLGTNHVLSSSQLITLSWSSLTSHLEEPLEPVDLHPEAEKPQNEAPTGRDGEAQNKPPDATRQISDATQQSTEKPSDVTQKSTETATKPAQLVIPEGVRPVPIAEIDKLIQRGYKRDDICAILDQNHQKYGAVVRARVTFFKQHPELMRVTSGAIAGLHPGMQQSHPETLSSDVRGANSSDVRNPENTANLGLSDVTQTGGSGRHEQHPRMLESHPADVTQQSSDAARDPFEAVKNMSDMEVINSLHLNRMV
jgi:hypothetical protein